MNASTLLLTRYLAQRSGDYSADDVLALVNANASLAPVSLNSLRWAHWFKLQEFQASALADGHSAIQASDLTTLDALQTAIDERG